MNSDTASIPLDTTPPLVEFEETHEPAKGNAELSLIAKVILWLVVISVICIILYIFYINKYQNNSADEFEMRYDNVHGDVFDDDAKAFLHHAEQLPHATALDHYRMGNVYLLNAKDHRAAHDHFKQALNAVRSNQTPLLEAGFIIDRIVDLNDVFADHPDVEDLPIQQTLLTFYEQKHREAERTAQALNNKIITGKLDDDKDLLKQKVILSKQNWIKDTQNVHDSTLHSELKNQIEIIRKKNNECAKLHEVRNYSDFTLWLQTRYDSDPEKTEKINKVLIMTNNNYPIQSMPDLKEQDLLVALWQRIHHPDNQTRISELKEALGNAVLDCVEGGAVVCMSGRNAKMWQALARLDANPDMGVLHTKQAVKNEIYERCAKVIDDFVGKEGSASEILKNAYHRNDNSEQVKELKETMAIEIDKIHDEYHDKLPAEQLNVIIAECRSVV